MSSKNQQEEDNEKDNTKKDQTAKMPSGDGAAFRVHFDPPQQQEKSSDSTSIMTYTTRPIGCVLDRPRRMFRIIRARGKALSSGGFGVAIATTSTTTTTTTKTNAPKNQADQCDTIKEVDAKAPLAATKETNQDTGTSSTTVTSSSTATRDYLFVEEALFLYERGLCTCYYDDSHGDNAGDDDDDDVDEKDTSSTTTTHLHAFDASQLYKLLESMGLPLAQYLVYSHLRAQDFRVLRHNHASQRWHWLQRQEEKLLQQQQQRQKKAQELQEGNQEDSKLPPLQEPQERDQSTSNKSATHVDSSESRTKDVAMKDDDNAEDDEEQPDQLDQEDGDDGDDVDVEDETCTNNKKDPTETLAFLRQQVRLSIQTAPPPTILSSSSSNDSQLLLSWDCYGPNAQFGKTRPGLPDFVVAVTYYHNPHIVTFQDLYQLDTQGIPLRLATVSDSGTVVMFGVTHYGVPSIATTT